MPNGIDADPVNKKMKEDKYYKCLNCNEIFSKFIYKNGTKYYSERKKYCCTFCGIKYREKIKVNGYYY